MTSTKSFSAPMPGTMGSAQLSFPYPDFAREKIGIIGLGFVGNAINHSFDGSLIPVIIRDPFKGFNATYDELKKCSSIFVSVPTPQSDDGTCDTGPLEEVLRDLYAVNFQGVIISKCTAPPKTYTRLQELYPNLVHAPEFLTAANAVEDYINGKFAFIGGSVSAYMREAERIIKISQPHLESIRYCSIAEASLAKYIINSFMATKVVFMNEIEALANELNCNYGLVANLVKADPRIGKSHMQVPGPDGAYGFGGACFPKDTSALLKFATDVGIHMNVLDAAVKKNTLLRLTEPK
jgi:UDPglucose 6-dehydrogenase